MSEPREGHEQRDEQAPAVSADDGMAPLINNTGDDADDAGGDDAEAPTG